MSDQQPLTLGETASVDGVIVSVGKPRHGPPAVHGTPAPTLGETDVQCATGMGIGHVAMKLANNTDTVIPLPEPADVTCGNLFDRSSATENHYAHQGEVWTSLLRLLSRRDELGPDESAIGILTYTIPVLPPDQRDIAPLTVTLPPPAGGESVSLAWDLTPDSTPPNPHVPVAEEPAEIALEVALRCSTCDTNLAKYGAPDYCPNCGTETTAGASNTHVYDRS